MPISSSGVRNNDPIWKSTYLGTSPLLGNSVSNNTFDSVENIFRSFIHSPLLLPNLILSSIFTSLFIIASPLNRSDLVKQPTSRGKNGQHTKSQSKHPAHWEWRRRYTLGIQPRNRGSRNRDCRPPLKLRRSYLKGIHHRLNRPRESRRMETKYR